MCYFLFFVSMYIVENKGGAIALILFAILCGGSFAPAMSFMERRGRLPQHIYLDYSIANFLVAVLIAFTFGQIGPGKVGMPNFFTQLSQVRLHQHCLVYWSTFPHLAKRQKGMRPSGCSTLLLALGTRVQFSMIADIDLFFSPDFLVCT